jgi:hypothetical protein
LLHELERRSENRHVSAYWVGLLNAGLGDNSRAIKCLKEARDDRDVWLVWLAAEPRFDLLRSEGLLDDLLGSIGLTHRLPQTQQP